ncbi:hypothetical protein Rwratislav_45310 [Rhodococcus wratislaviensis IFP 2016]|nr:hypothetical protein Rwratislav_45310 [Rhodococcus wratislaviensis IFP 2016]
MTDTYRTTPSNPQRWTARLAALGLQLPPVAAPAAAYTPALRTGNLVYTSGQLPLVDGSSAYTGKVGADKSSQEATAAARICTPMPSQPSMPWSESITSSRSSKSSDSSPPAPASTANQRSSTAPPNSWSISSATTEHTHVLPSELPNCRATSPSRSR